MAAPATIDEYLDLVRKSGVADEKRLNAHVQRLRTAGGFPTEPSRLANALVRDGLLTTFQAEQLLKGKWKRFFLGKYKVLEQLGTGGMGLVYLCEHKLMRRRVAVKVLPTAKASEPSSLERFYREARAAAALDHPNIVHAYDIDQDEALHFLVMEYVDGSSLQDIVKKSGPLPPIRAAHYIRQASIGLDHAHKAGLVHRDIKPGNILVDRTGTVKLLDMGLARFFADEEDILTRKYDENVLGTADYLAPEQALDSHTVDIRADIYSLGATFYFVLTGKTPFGEGTTTQKLIWHQTRKPKPVRSIRPEVPEALSALIERMMAKDPNDRYASPSDVTDALAPWTRESIPPPAESELPRLSLAASGAGPATEMTTAPAIPLAAGQRKSWQVATPPNARAAAVVVSGAAVERNPPIASPAAKETLATSPAATIAAQSTAKNEPAAPEALWNRPAFDTEAAASVDTSAPSPTPNRTRPVGADLHRSPTPEVARRRFWKLALLVAVIVLSVLLGISFASGFFGRWRGSRAEAGSRSSIPVRPGISNPSVEAAWRNEVEGALCASTADKADFLKRFV